MSQLGTFNGQSRRLLCWQLLGLVLEQWEFFLSLCLVADLLELAALSQRPINIGHCAVSAA